MIASYMSKGLNLFADSKYTCFSDVVPKNICERVKLALSA